VSATTPTGQASLPGDPVAAIVEVVARLEPDLDREVVRATVEQVAPSRTKRHRLAEATTADPHVLTDGRSSAPVAVGQLVRALLPLGASRLVAPCCADCGKAAPLRSRRGAERICDPCAARARDQTTTCSACGRHRRATHRDRHGQPRCRDCPPEEPNPLASISATIARLDWNAGSPRPSPPSPIPTTSGWCAPSPFGSCYAACAAASVTATPPTSRQPGSGPACAQPSSSSPGSGSEGLSLAVCRQADIDRWLATGSRTRHNARDFVGWALARRLAVDLDLPPRPTAAATRPIDADQRWTIARRLLTDTDLDPADRVAGLLVLGYAQPVTTIARLSLDRITHGPGGVHLLLGSAPALLPEPLADLVLELAATRKGHATVGSPPTSPWLLPGGTPGRPIGADRLAIRLGRLGVPARPGRAAALTDLAAHLPVGVLARLLGISPGAATSWRTSAGGTWSGYAAELAQRGQPHQPDTPWGDLPR